jgi:hypothetical protein
VIQKSLYEITLADLSALVGNVREGKSIEFKSVLPDKSDKEIVSFVGGVSALANTVGGDFIIGVSANSDGIATAINGVKVDSVDTEKLPLDQLLANWLEPRLPRVDIHPVACGEGRYVLLIRVSRSWVGPHRLTKDNKFYGRNSAGKYPLDVSELRTAFVFGEATAERIRSFRAGRLAKIVANEGPVPLTSAATMVLHIVSSPSFADRRLIDVATEIASGRIVPLPLDGIGAENQLAINLDGVLNYVMPSSQGATSYAQLFRNGAIEGVSRLSRESDGTLYLAGTAFSNKIVSGTRQYLRAIASLDAGFPAFAFLSLCGVSGCHMKYDAGGIWSLAGPLRDHVIPFPEIAFDSEKSDVPTILRPIFNIVWNAFGFPQCDMYTSDGRWKGTG